MCLRQPFTLTSACYYQALEHCQAPPLNTIIIQSPLNTNTLYSLWNVRHSILQITQGREKSKFQVNRLIQYSNFDTLSSLVQRLIFFEDFLHFLLLVTAALSQQQPFSKHSTFASNSPDDVHLSWQVSRLPLPPDPGSSSWMVVEWMPACGRTPCPRWCWWCTHLKSDLFSSFPSYRQPGTQEHFSLDPSSHLLLIFCWSIHPLSIFSPVALRIFNGCKCALGTERLQSVP